MTTVKEAMQLVVVSSLKAAAAQARSLERKAAKAYPNGFARDHICHLEDAHHMAAKVYEEALAQYEMKLSADEAPAYRLSELPTHGGVNGSPGLHLEDYEKTGRGYVRKGGR